MIQLPENQKFGSLIHEKDIKLFRKYFDEMVKLHGIQLVFYRPKESKHYTTWGEIKENFEEPQIVGCLFNDHPDQYTMKKLGWNAELQSDASLIDVPDDLEGVQSGALFVIPSGIDNAPGRLFRVDKMKVGLVYPSSITCYCVPEYEDTMPSDSMYFKQNDFKLLFDEDDEE